MGNTKLAKNSLHLLIYSFLTVFCLISLQFHPGFTQKPYFYRNMKRILKILTAGFIMLLMSRYSGYGQYFGFVKNNTVTVVQASDTLSYAWGGGLNYAQFSSIDLDYNGVKDLFIFDRTGNRWVTLLNGGTAGKLDYTLADEFRSHFPVLSEWALLLDYNGDHKEDIFAYHNGGVMVYKNTGDAGNGLQFTLVKDQLKSDYGSAILSLYISLADIPAITDVDGDGDIDILTYAVNGGCVELHKNLSQEMYGHSDSLVYKMTTDNWGNYTEGASGYDITLSDSCDTTRQGPGGYRHTGSSLLAMDMDGDGDKDLVLGDVGGFNLAYLRNDGSTTHAVMGDVDFNFPQNNSATVPVNITLFPAGFYVDVNNDGKRDMIITPNASGSSETRMATWRYQNDGADDFPDFKFKEINFIQGDMIDLGEGSFPRMVDYDRDGLMDLVIGNTTYWTGTGQLALYRNTGTASAPVYQLVTNDLGGLSAYTYKNIIPTFGDMDGDGDADMIIGEITGYIHYFENTAPVMPNSPASFVLTTTQYFGIKENSFSAPCIIDLDMDGVNDIVCGSRLGKLNYYRNTGTATTAVFSSVQTIAQLGNVSTVDVQVSTSGYSVPEFFVHNGKLELFVGSLKGNIYHYTDIYDQSNAIQSSFLLQTDNTGFVWDGIRSAVTVANLNNDNYPDMILGNYCGGVSLFYGNPTSMGTEENETGITGISAYPNPVQDVVRVKLDTEQSVKLTVYDISGRVIASVRNYYSGMAVNMAGWENGFYIFTIETDNGKSRSLKVLKLN